MKLNIETIGIIGAGQMGRGIAQVAAHSGFKVFVYDIEQKSCNAAQEFIKSQLKRGVDKKKWTQDIALNTMDHLKFTSNLKEFSNCDFVIEAATENKKVKFEIFKTLDEICNLKTILTSNTSSISITEIAAVTNRPSLVAGMHFMNPVPVMKLVEGIKGLQTSDETFSVVEKVASQMGKQFIMVSDVEGFAVNRILMPMINEAIYAHYEGVASIEELDKGMKLGANWPMGPFELADFIGLDTCLAIMEVLYDGLGDSKYRPCPLIRRYVSAGYLGKKSGRGFYNYEK